MYVDTEEALVDFRSACSKVPRDVWIRTREGSTTSQFLRSDGADGFLPGVYARCGFKESGRLSWDDLYDPPRWTYEKHGRPDVMMMKLQEEDRKRLMKAKDAPRNLGTEEFQRLQREYVVGLIGEEETKKLEKKTRK